MVELKFNARLMSFEADGGGKKFIKQESRFEKLPATSTPDWYFLPETLLKQYLPTAYSSGVYCLILDSSFYTKAYSPLGVLSGHILL